MLEPLLPRLIKAHATSDIARQRACLVMDWLVRVHTPAWLDLWPALQPHAATLRALPPITSTEHVRAATLVLADARDASWVAWDAARASASVASRVASWGACDAAMASAMASARAASWVVAWDADGDADGDAARAAAMVDAARAAASVAAYTGGHAASQAARQSAMELFSRMIEVGQVGHDHPV